LFICFIFIALPSCNYLYSKENYLTDFETFIEHLDIEYTTHENLDWEKIEEEYIMFSEVYYEKFRDELTDTELNKIAEYNRKYSVIKLKKETNDIIDQTQEVIGNVIDELIK
jgi:hypothetical protein